MWIVVASKDVSRPSFSSSSTIILCKITHNEKIWNYVLIPSSKKGLEQFHIHFVRSQRFVQHLSRLFHVIMHSACTFRLVVHELFVGILTNKGRCHPSISSIWNNYSITSNPRLLSIPINKSTTKCEWSKTFRLLFPLTKPKWTCQNQSFSFAIVSRMIQQLWSLLENWKVHDVGSYSVYNAYSLRMQTSRNPHSCDLEYFNSPIKIPSTSQI
jgi:hypothetical protein